VDLDANGTEHLSGCVLDRPDKGVRCGMERQDKPHPVPRRIPCVFPTDPLARLLSFSFRPGLSTLAAFTMLTSALGPRMLTGALSRMVAALGIRRHLGGARGHPKGQDHCGDDRKQLVR
jgi:hypothetical protein